MIELLSNNGYVVTALLSAVGLFFGIVIRQHLRREEDKEKEHKEKEAELKRDIDEKHEANAEKLEAICETVGAIQRNLADISVLTLRVEMAEKSIQDLRDFKHSVAAPTARYTEYLQQDKPWKVNEVLLERIEKKIDAYEERSSTTRHDTQNVVHELALKVAVIEKMMAPK